MLSRFFIDRPVFAWVIAIVMMLIGVLSIYTLPVSQYPMIAPPQVSITATYPGASAETIENTVTQVIEQNLTGLDGYLYMSAESLSAGRVSIVVTFEAGTDPDMAQVQVQNKIQTAITSLPSVVQRMGVEIQKTSASFLMVLGLTSTDPKMTNADLGDFMENNIKEPISRVKGVGEVQLFGSSYAMRIWIDPDKLVKYKLNPSDVVGVVSAQNVQVAAGGLSQQPTNGLQQFTATINSTSLMTKPEEFEKILVKTDVNGAKVYLRDVAKIEMGQKDYNAQGSYNSQSSAGLAVKLASGANAIETRRLVEEKVRELKPSFPAGVEYVIPYDTTPFVQSALKGVVKTLFEAIVLVVFVMYLFLQNWRATIIPTIAVPVVLLGTFAVLAAAGFSINMLTMFAMVLAIGLLVDDAIVVVENVERVMREEKLEAREATIKSMRQIQGALIGIAMVLSAVFVPMAFMGGSTGVIYRQFSITIVSAMVLSVVVALTLTPALCAKILKEVDHDRHMEKTGFFGWFNRGFDTATHWVKDLIAATLGKRLVMGTCYAILLGFVGLGFTKLPTAFMPEEDQGVLLLLSQLPDGATMERTHSYLTDVEQHILNTEKADVKSIFTVRGFSFSGMGQNMGMGFVSLKDWSERTSRQAHHKSIVQRIQGAMMMSPNFKEGFSFIFPLPAVPELGVAEGFDFYIRDNAGAGHAKLMEVMNEFLAKAAADKRLTQVRHNGMSDTTVLKLKIDYEKLSALGISIQDVNDSLSVIMAGSYLNDFLDRGRTKQVWIQGAPESRYQVEDLMQWHVRNNRGEMVPFSSFMTTSWEKASPRLERFNGSAAVNIQGSPAPGVSSGEALAIVEDIAKEVLPEGFDINYNGITYQEKASGQQAPYLYAISLIVVFLCLAALYESWSVPIAVLLVVPTGVLGALGLTYFMGMHNDIYFQVGLLTTVGLVSKNAILIVEFAKEMMDKGIDAVHAATEAVRLRLRPIVMTSLAFGLGVLPLIFAYGAGSGAQNAIGTSVFGGMLAGTILCVLFVPFFYVLIAKASHLEKNQAK